MTLLARIYAAVAVAIALSAVGKWLFQLGLIPIPFNAFILLLLISALASVAMVSRPLMQPRAALYTAIETAIAMATLLYGPVFYGILFESGVAIFMPGVVLQIFMSLAIFGLFLGLAWYLIPENWLQKAIALAFLIYGFSIIGDLVTRSILDLYFERPAGFLGNANDGGAQIVFLSLFLIPWRKPNWHGVAWLTLSLAFVAMTMSRGAFLMWLLSSGFYGYCVWQQGRKRARVALAIGTGVLAMLLIAFVAVPLSAIKDMDPGIDVSRIIDFKELLSGNLGSLERDSRFFLLESYLERIEKSPIFGHGAVQSMNGIGLYEPQGPHNFFVARMYDEGLVGELAYLMFLNYWAAFFLLRRDRKGVVFITLWAVFGVFSHNLDQDFERTALFAVLAMQSLVPAWDESQKVVSRPREALLTWLAKPIRFHRARQAYGALSRYPADCA